MSIHEQARAEAEKRYAVPWRDGDLLDEATRLADEWNGSLTATLLRCLVSRVQQAEAERDAARGKLDKVRALAEELESAGRYAEGIGFRWPGRDVTYAGERLLAILDAQDAASRPNAVHMAQGGLDSTNGPQNGTHETGAP